jgi:hypothetical protein
MKLENLSAGRMYSFVYEGEMKLNKGGRAGIAPNPLFGQVTKRAVYAGQAATHETYVRKWASLNPGRTYQADTERTPRFVATENPCVVRYLSDNTFACRIINPRTVKTEYFVSGQPATAEQMAIIEMYKPARAEREETDVRIMFPKVENLSNVES